MRGPHPQFGGSRRSYRSVAHNTDGSGRTLGEATRIQAADAGAWGVTGDGVTVEAFSKVDWK